MTLIITEMYNQRNPTRWNDFDRHMPGVPTNAFGFSGSLPEINRWAARYRAAASLEGIQLSDYQSSETIEGYSSLIKATLVWSAFERYLSIIGIAQNQCNDLLEKYNINDIAGNVAHLDENNRFYAYIRSKVTNRTLTKELDNYFQRQSLNVSYLLSAIRHIFGHGHLTPGSNDVNGITTAQICDLLCVFHMSVMDNDFSERVDNFEKMISHEHPE